MSHTPVPIHRGMTFGYYARNGYYSSKSARLAVDQMASLNIQWVCLISIVLQDTFASTRQYRDFYQTPADDELREIIDYIHKKGMKVQLRPMLECWDGTQRMAIRFPGECTIIPGKPISHWGQWFESMTQRTLHYARLAQRSGCEAFGIDSELDFTVWQQKYWKQVVAAARSVYRGHLTTGHTPCVDFRKELQEHPDHWFHDLDSLGVSFYHPLADAPGATKEEMLQRIQPHLEYYREVAALYRKPFYLAECGCCSHTHAVCAPHLIWEKTGDYDGEEQARYLDTVLTALWDEPWFMGMYWWKWEELNDRPNLRDDPRGDKGNAVWNKPAAEVMKQWYSRPDRQG